MPWKNLRETAMVEISFLTTEDSYQICFSPLFSGGEKRQVLYIMVYVILNSLAIVTTV